MSVERRTSARFIVSLPATIMTADGKSYDCEILDLSETGCKVRLVEPVQLFGAVKLVTESDQTSARVIWNEGLLVGLWFPNAVDEAPQPGLLRRVWSQIRGTGRASDA